MLLAELPVQRKRTLYGLSSTAGPVARGLARFDRRGGHEVLDAAAGRPTCDQLAAFRFWRHPHICKAGLRQPGLDPLDRSGPGDAATKRAGSACSSGDSAAVLTTSEIA